MVSRVSSPLMRSRLDRVVFELGRLGILVERHSYSYRVMYRDRIVMGIHFYPGYREISIRLYKSFRELAEEVLPTVRNVLRKLFPDHKIMVKWYPPGVHMH